MFAARNIKLCTKDCACLFVCPTGATDTEDGTIDRNRCIDGCRLCVDACPSHAIYLVYENYPEKPDVGRESAETLVALLAHKAEMYSTFRIRTEAKESEKAKSIFEGFSLSNRILAEDCWRESGYLVADEKKMEELDQCKVVQKLFAETFGDSSTPIVDEIFDKVTHALEKQGDTDELAIFLCTECGFLSLQKTVGKCPHCGAGPLQEL